ncbi:Guanylate kinase family protein [Trichomonas vaginalis G3]|uniref:guanylate kinase n=1 Tax=Trichomonas vaginalis (strain ATCC PRA-98 / G3) TaxID=412133 RepID=A2FL77_TRIV3|nr:guanylate kinase protein [Trichomonas vaginalis G3]EAX94333.1 Guanylate kinase family protein [Trichomonas vaginalis G3]KAI5521816.1 guanylate kinase protein [Trichomonas vaginalis G3]|eukprot:XP_001307263.1 Guanylate kinase family protein [Trichomonas vaginalis G3]
MSRPIVFVGPSGIGKGTIIGKLRELYPGRFDFSVSHTTRKPREGETDGVQYNFVTRKKFEEMIKNGEFLEHAEVHGNYYGTSFAAIHHVEESGKICILDINIDGAIAVYKSNMTPYIILLKPTSFEALEARLRGRATETEEQIQKRLQTTKRELERYEELKDMFDLTIINDRLDVTLIKISEELFKRYKLP